jgi:hypothetical protein
MWVKGAPLHFIVDSIKSKEPDLNRGHQAVGPIDDNTTPASLHHRVAPPRKRSLHQPTMSPSL